MTLVDASVLTFHPFVSRESPKAFLLGLTPFDFQFDSDYRFQAEAAIPAKRLEFPFQSAYLDASAITSGTTYLNVAVTNHTVAIRAGYQGYRPLLCNPGSQIFTFSNPGAKAAGGSQILKVFLLNIPVIGTEWAVLAGAGAGAASVWG